MTHNKILLTTILSTGALGLLIAGTTLAQSQIAPTDTKVKVETGEDSHVVKTERLEVINDDKSKTDTESGKTMSERTETGTDDMSAGKDIRSTDKEAHGEDGTNGTSEHITNSIDSSLDN